MGGLHRHISRVPTTSGVAGSGSKSMRSGNWSLGRRREGSERSGFGCQDLVTPGLGGSRSRRRPTTDPAETAAETPLQSPSQSPSQSPVEIQQTAGRSQREGPEGSGVGCRALAAPGLGGSRSRRRPASGPAEAAAESPSRSPSQG
jgi:hypothetical protein